MCGCVWRLILTDLRTRIGAVLFGSMNLVVLSLPAAANKIENPIAVFAGLDKITATITTFEVPVNKTKQFGTLQVTPRICYTRPITEAPKTTSFVEVNEVLLNGNLNRIFTGWMFAASPGLNAVEHPVYDVWLTNCKTPAAETSEESAPNSPSTPSAPSNN
ncbi:MAG: DUF2155 domain-containing protein [Rhizobiales bacterium]|nr:DUF2155 domain-containing protein [Hyphomicrobiales bacterium]